MMHIPVLLNEVKEYFNDISGIFIDATLGLGGHSYALLEQNPHLNVIGIDKDKEAIEIAKEQLKPFGDRFRAINGSFSSEITRIISKYNNISGILADIGISSYQVDTKRRGFSFESENLDMRMNLDSTLDATYVINSYTKEQLRDIFHKYGEIYPCDKILNIILEYRKKRKITSGKELSALLESNISYKSKIHPATLVFQALRIEVNNELDEISRFLDNIEQLKNTKIAIISFHSLEDRIVKDKFKLWTKQCICDSSVMKCECGGNNAKGVILTKKPITPSVSEISNNKRARSAKMRCFRFNG